MSSGIITKVKVVRRLGVILKWTQNKSTYVM